MASRFDIYGANPQYKKATERSPSSYERPKGRDTRTLDQLINESQGKRSVSKGNIPSKKEWYATQANPNVHSKVNENQRLIEKYAAQGKDFTKTEQYKKNMGYLQGVTVNRGGDRGRIYENDPTLNTGHDVGDAYRREMLNQPAGVFNIDPKKARLGLENDANSFFRFNQQLMEKNPAAYEKARPWASGKTARQFFTKIPGDIAKSAYSGISQIAEPFIEGWRNTIKPKLNELGDKKIIKDALGIVPGAASDFMGIGKSKDDLSNEYNNYIIDKEGKNSQQWINKKKRDTPYSTETSDVGDPVYDFELDDIWNEELYNTRAGTWTGGPNPYNTRAGVLTGNQQSDRERKLQFIQEVGNFDFDADFFRNYSDEQIDSLFETVKRQTGKGISEDIAEEQVDIFEPDQYLNNTGFNTGSSYNIDLEKAQKEAADMNNPFPDWTIRSNLGFRKPDKKVTPELLDSWSMEDIMETNPAYDVFTDDQKIELQNKLRDQSLFAGGGYAEPYAGGGAPKKNIYDLLKSYNETAYEK